MKIIRLSCLCMGLLLLTPNLQANLVPRSAAPSTHPSTAPCWTLSPSDSMATSIPTQPQSVAQTFKKGKYRWQDILLIAGISSFLVSVLLGFIRNFSLPQFIGSHYIMLPLVVAGNLFWGLGMLAMGIALIGLIVYWRKRRHSTQERIQLENRPNVQ